MYAELIAEKPSFLTQLNNMAEKMVEKVEHRIEQKVEKEVEHVAEHVVEHMAEHLVENLEDQVENQVEHVRDQVDHVAEDLEQVGEKVKEKAEKEGENLVEKVIETFVNKILEGLVKTIPGGIPELQIPPFDPLEIPGEKDMDIDTFFAKMQGNFSDIVVKGLASMGAPKVSIKDKKLTATTTAKLEISGKYRMNGSALLLFTINSNSTFKCVIEALSMTIGLSLKDSKDLKAIVELKSGDVKLELEEFEHPRIASGLLHPIAGLIATFVEESIGSPLQKMLQKFIDQFKEELTI